MENAKPKSRVQKAINRANERLNIKWAAAILATSTLLSALLGLYRDRLLNSMYFDTYKVGIDAYTVAFTIPDFMFFVLVSGALSVSFIPVFNQRLAKGNKESAWQLSSSMINFLALATLGASILIMVFAPLLVQYVVGPGLNEQGQALATSMMRVIAVNPFIFSITTVIASIQQAVGRFVFFALSPMIYNIGIIFGAVVLTNKIEWLGWQGGIMGVALGVVIGAVLQLIVSSLGLIGLKFDYRFKIFKKNLGFRKVLRLLPARSMDQGLDYVSSIVDTNLASRMAEGTVRAYQQASTLSAMPVNLVGVAISTAAFPEMTERLSQGRPDLFCKELRKVIQVIVWLALPIAVIMFLSRGYIVSIIKVGGDSLIAGIFGILAITILLRSVFHIASRSFYAQQDTKTPMLISVCSIVVAIAFALWFTFGLRMGAYGLAWAQVIWAALEIATLFVMMNLRMPKLFNRQFGVTILKMIVAAAIMSIETYIMVSIVGLRFDDQNILMVVPQLLLIGGISAVVYLIVSYLLKLEEAMPVISKISKFFLPKPKVTPPPSQE
ncbi:MAG: murein biosynthesis integral membrane protein MurJ [Candidatus Nomurabacteria bacterium]|jgi:putative peptidoglycan lipid II flippase|nr:murein biosynthesis integral membrane protein MurJ [Candidatus Nomurabacteria bacterium]